MRPSLNLPIRGQFLPGFSFNCQSIRFYQRRRLPSTVQHSAMAAATLLLGMVSNGFQPVGFAAVAAADPHFVWE
jgi:hypothetical protein